MSFQPFSPFLGFGGGAVSFNPLTLSPSLWLDGSDASTLYDATSGGSFVAADGTVARWEDKSGNAAHLTQSSASACPLRKAAVWAGKDIVRFDGLTDFMGPFPGSISAETVFVVAQSANGIICGTTFANRSWRIEAQSAGTLFRLFLRTSTTSFTSRDSPAGSAGMHIAAIRIPNPISVSPVLVGRDGHYNSHVFAGTLTEVGVGSGYVGAYDGSGGGPNAFAASDVAEILRFPLALTDSEMLSVTNYLGAKWGISVA